MLKVSPIQLRENFEGATINSSRWSLVLGQSFGFQCGTMNGKQALYFGASGTREAVTVDLDMRHGR